MIIIPAIDIKDSKCVRLFQGNFDKKTIYSDNPVEVALKWQQQGAQLLHIIDLDGAKEGKPINTKIISTIVRKISVQVGGGIRNKAAIKKYLEAGALRVVLGTAVLEDFEFAKEIFKEFGDKIVIGLDAKDGRLMTRGWITESGLDTFVAAKKLSDLGAGRIIYTDILKDGSLKGPNFSALEKLIAKVKIPVIASGGISNISQIKKLKVIGAEGVILGKALYEGKIDLQEALNVN